MSYTMFDNKPKKKPFNIIEFTRIIGLAAAAVALMYWVGVAKYEHRWIARGLVLSMIILNWAFNRYVYIPYNRDISRKGTRVKG